MDINLASTAVDINLASTAVDIKSLSVILTRNALTCILLIIELSMTACNICSCSSPLNSTLDEREEAIIEPQTLQLVAFGSLTVMIK